MRLSYRGTRQRYAGLLLLLFGGAAVVAARKYDIGTATAMGPGYFPLVLGCILLVLGIAAQFDASGDKVEPVDRKEIVALLATCAGIVAFAELVERLGLAPAIFAALVCACFYRLRRHAVEMLIIYIVLTAVAVGVFIYLLELPMQTFIAP